MKKHKIIGIFLIIIGLIIPIYMIINHKRNDDISQNSVLVYLSKTSLIDVDIPVITNEINKRYDYIAILEIPAINLRKGLVSIDSEYNDIAYNISILKPSEMPNVHNSNLILAAHNGNSDVSFFKDLERLNLDDVIYVYYNGDKYVYSVANSYTVEKTGKVNIVRDKTKNAITLITCKNGTDNEQIIYIGYLIAKETY